MTSSQSELAVPPSLARLLFLCGTAAGLLRGASAGAQSFRDAQLLVQVAMEHGSGSPRRPPVEELYVSTVNTTEDLMFWSVMVRTLSMQQLDLVVHLNVPTNSFLWSKRLPINRALNAANVSAFMKAYTPEQVGMNSINSLWQQLTPFQYSAAEFKRVVFLGSDLVVLHRIVELVRRAEGDLTLARDEGECKDVDEAVEVEKPSTALYSMIPDLKVESWLKSSGLALMREVGAGSAMRFDGKNLAPLAFQMVHPKKKPDLYHGVEVVSASCLMHHKDEDYPDEFPQELSKVVLLGTEGKQLITEILSHEGVAREKKLNGTLAGLEKAGKKMMAHVLRLWFDTFNSKEVQGIMGALGSW